MYSILPKDHYFEEQYRNCEQLKNYLVSPLTSYIEFKVNNFFIIRNSVETCEPIYYLAGLFNAYKSQLDKYHPLLIGQHSNQLFVILDKIDTILFEHNYSDQWTYFLNNPIFSMNLMNLTPQFRQHIGGSEVQLLIEEIDNLYRMRIRAPTVIFATKEAQTRIVPMCIRHICPICELVHRVNSYVKSLDWLSGSYKHILNTYQDPILLMEIVRCLQRTIFNLKSINMLTNSITQDREDITASSLTYLSANIDIWKVVYRKLSRTSPSPVSWSARKRRVMLDSGMCRSISKFIQTCQFMPLGINSMCHLFQESLGLIDPTPSNMPLRESPESMEESEFESENQVNFPSAFFRHSFSLRSEVSKYNLSRIRSCPQSKSVQYSNWGLKGIISQASLLVWYGTLKLNFGFILPP